MKTIPKIFIVFLLIPISYYSFGQDTPVIRKIKPFKPPVVQTYLGIRHGDDTLIKAEAEQLVALPLKVIDKNKNIYPVVNYRFVYNQKGFIQDPETGDAKVVFNLLGSWFDKSPLPPLWIKNIQPTLKKDEYFYFLDIMVKDKLGRVFPAPNIKITVK